MKEKLYALIQAGLITFDAYSWTFGYVDMELVTHVFQDSDDGVDKYILSVKEDDWNDDPDMAVASTLADLIDKGELVLRAEYQ